jgi:hypothetical protein
LSYFLNLSLNISVKYPVFFQLANGMVDNYSSFEMIFIVFFLLRG